MLAADRLANRNYKASRANLPTRRWAEVKNGRKKYKFISQPRHPTKDRRFVAGRGNFVADIDRPNMLHVAPLSSHYPAAIINNIDISEAMMMDGVIDVITGAEIGAAIQPLMNGLDTPKVQRFPLAVNRVRYAGKWVCAVVAGSRAIAEDALEKLSLTLLPNHLFWMQKKHFCPPASASGTWQQYTSRSEICLGNGW